MIKEECKIYEKIKGAIIGVAYGDAMGMPTEMLSREKIKQEYPDGIHTFLPSNSSMIFGRDMKAGEITDDTINTIMVIDMLKQTQGVISAEKYVQHLNEWINNSEKSNYVSGPSTIAAIEKIKKGIPIEQSGIYGTTNGAQMKITPIGVISDYNNMDKLVQNVVEICKPTHNTSIAIQGASAVAAVISYVIRNDASYLDLWDVAEEAIKISKNYGFDYPSPSLEYKMNLAKKIADEHIDINSTIDRIYYEIGSSLDTIQTIPSVFAVVQIAKGNPEISASISAMIGYDTDTIGAIATSICGAMNPIFKKSDIEYLENINNINFDELSQILYKIYKS